MRNFQILKWIVFRSLTWKCFNGKWKQIPRILQLSASQNLNAYEPTIEAIKTKQVKVANCLLIWFFAFNFCCFIFFNIDFSFNFILLIEEREKQVCTWREWVKEVHWISVRWQLPDKVCSPHILTFLSFYQITLNSLNFYII